MEEAHGGEAEGGERRRMRADMGQPFLDIDRINKDFGGVRNQSSRPYRRRRGILRRGPEIYARFRGQGREDRCGICENRLSRHTGPNPDQRKKGPSG